MLNLHAYRWQMIAQILFCKRGWIESTLLIVASRPRGWRITTLLYSMGGHSVFFIDEIKEDMSIF